MIDKKQIKREYKEKIRPAGVYAIINNVEKKVFIGQTRNPSGALQRIILELERGTHPYKNMVKDYAKKNKDDFEIKLISELDISDLEENEVVEQLILEYERNRSVLLNQGYSFYNSRTGH